ncbi:MAG: hypothetical protein QME94_11690, partial [Anaerolineae bacterium]|nr:hypothetical protein [Anaerolineae bacterium]
WLQAGTRPAGGRTLALATCPACQALYLGTEDHGLWLTSDQGMSWSSALAGHSVQAIATAGERLALAGTEDGLYLSEDHGASWRRLASPQVQGSVQALAASATARRLYVGIEGRPIQFSDDGGETWQTLPPLPLQAPVTALLLDGEHLYAGTRQGLWHCRLPGPEQDSGEVKVGDGSLEG